jgi:glyoxylase-like metal-dependent hydrolase (beta-lactamase superfamily II)
MSHWSRRRCACIAAVVALAIACGGTSREPDVPADAAAAMGGRARIDGVKSLALEGEGTAYALGQSRTLDSELLSWRVSGYRREVAFDDHRWREESVRTPTFVTGWPEPAPLVEGYDDGLAYDVEEGAASRRDSLVSVARRVELYHDPVGLLRAIGAGELRAVATRSDTVDLVTDAGDRLTLVVDSTTRLPRRIVSKGHEPALGDVNLVTELDDFVTVDGLSLPSRIRKRVDTTVVADLRITRTVVNPAIGELRAPADARRAAEPPGAATVTVSEEAPGVWYLAGEGHHSVAVDLGDHLTLIEAPVDDRRTLAVIARARALRPGKPLTEVINTHHHFDHSGGIRAAVSEGLRVVTHESNRGFFEAMVARPATVRPDALARRPRPLTMETVGDKLVLGEGRRRLEVYQVTGSRHCATMLMVYLPGERLLVEADAYQPAPLQGRPPVSHPHAANLLENIERRGLRVDRLLPIHGRPVPFGELVAAAKTSPPPD